MYGMVAKTSTIVCVLRCFIFGHLQVLGEDMEIILGKAV